MGKHQQLLGLKDSLDGKASSDEDEFYDDSAFVDPEAKKPSQNNDMRLPYVTAKKRTELDKQNDLAEIYGRLDWDNNNYEVTVFRTYPKFVEGVQVGGLVGMYHYAIDEAEIRRLHKGGKYRVAVHGDHPKKGEGRHYLGSARIEIAGQPALPDSESGLRRRREDDDEGGEERSEGAAASVQTDGSNERFVSFLTKQAEQASEEKREAERRAERRIREAEERARRDAQERMEIGNSRRGEGPDINALVQNMTTTWAHQSEQQRSEMRDLIQLVKGDDSAQRAMLQISQQHQAELATMRERFESEIERTRASADRRLDEERERSRREIDQVTRGHDMQVQTIRDQNTLLFDAIKTSHESRVQLLSEQLGLTREDLKKFSNYKAPDTLEEIKKLVALKDAFEGLGGGGRNGRGDDDDDEDDKPKSGVDRLMDVGERLLDSEGGQKMLQALVLRGMAPQVSPVQVAQMAAVAQENAATQLQAASPERPAIPRAPTPAAVPSQATPQPPQVGAPSELSSTDELAAQLESLAEMDEEEAQLEPEAVGEAPGGAEDARNAEQEGLQKAMHVIFAMENAANQQEMSEEDWTQLLAVVTENTSEEERAQIVGVEPPVAQAQLQAMAGAMQLPLEALFTPSGLAILVGLKERLTPSV